ncbi:MAG: hypothetical protein KGM18_07085 [Sphingomonadales bacterium]|nr:hypothetical protein [Sphingomonadales bacterium]
MIGDTNTTAQAFQDEWNRLPYGCHPIGPLLRADHSIPWVRFHSLPSSKRYPENDAERAIILNRAYQLGDTLLGRANCWIISTSADDREPTWAFGGSLEYDVGTVDEFIVPYFVRKADWKAGAFDQLLNAIAEDDASYVWVSREDGSIFAPYDGGFDIFAVSPERIAALRSRWPEWLSNEPSGL